MYETPLSAASGTGDVTMVSYVLKKGIRFIETCNFMKVVQLYTQDKGSLDMVLDFGIASPGA